MIRLILLGLFLLITHLSVIGQNKIWILEHKMNSETNRLNYSDCNRMIIGSHVSDLLYDYNYIYLHDVGKLEWKGAFTQRINYKKLADTTELYDDNWNKLTTCTYSAESGHLFRKLTDTFLQIISCIKLKKITSYFSKFFSSIHHLIGCDMNHWSNGLKWHLQSSVLRSSQTMLLPAIEK